MAARKSRLGDDPLDFLDLSSSETAVASAPREPQRRTRILVNTRLDPELVQEAKRVARLSGDSVTALVTEAIERELKRRKKTLVKTLREEIEALEREE